MKDGNIGPKNIITSYYQIRGNKYSFNISEVDMTGGKNNWMTRK